MESVGDLFILLDGWSDQRFDEEMSLQPDPALEVARTAVRTGSGLAEALTAVREQIDVTAPALRLFRHDLVASSRRTSGELSAEVLENMLCDLHVAAARIHVRRDEFGDARAHLLRAIATGSTSAQPRLRLVELYMVTGEHDAAVGTLARTAEEGTFGALSLLELAVDLIAVGAAGAAADALGRAARLDRIGLVASVCGALGAELGTPRTPTSEELQEAFSSAGAALHAGRPTDALGLFKAVVMHDPRAAPAWYSVGSAHRSIAETATNTPPSHDADSVVAVVMRAHTVTAEDAYTEMAYAAEAFRIAAALEPDLWIATDSLVWAELWLGNTRPALELAARAVEQHPGAGPWETYAVALLVCGQVNDAYRAAEAILARDPGNDVARETISIAHAIAAPGVEPADD